MNETEISRMLVRLLGDGSLYTKMCNDAVKDTNAAAKSISISGKIIEGTQKTLEGFGRALQRVGSGMRSLGTLASVGITAPITALAGVATNEFNNFESALSRMKGLVGLSDDTIQEFKLHILELSKDVGKAPLELASAMENITSSGIQGAAALETLDITAKAAAGGLGEVRSVSDTVTSAMNAYGVANLSATKATDILVAAVREGKAEADTFAPVLGNVLPIANEMGISFDEAAGSIAYLTLATGSAATAATQYQNILAQTLKLNPEKEAGKRLTQLGIDVVGFQKSVGEEGLLPSLIKLKEELARTGHSLKDAFPDVQAMTAALQLTGANAEKAASVIANVGNAAGSTDTAFQAAAETTRHQLNKAMAEMKVILIEIGEMLVPIFAKFTAGLGSVMQAWKSLTPESKKWVLVIAAAAAAIGPLLIGLGLFISVVGGVITGLGAMVGFVGSFIGLINPWTIGLAAVATGLVYLFTQTELGGKVVQWFQQQWSTLIEYLGPAIKGISAAISNGDLELAFQIAWVQIKLIFAENTQALQEIWIRFQVAFTNSWYKTLNTIKTTWTEAQDKIAQITVITEGLITGSTQEEITQRLQILRGMQKDKQKLLKEDADNAVKLAKAAEAAGENSVDNISRNLKKLKAERDKLVNRAMNPLAKGAAPFQGQGSGLIPGIANDPAIKEAGDALEDLDKKAKIKIEMKFDAAGKGSTEALSRINDYRNAIGFQYNVPNLVKKQAIDPWDAVRQHVAANPDRFNPKMVRGGGFKNGDANEGVTELKQNWLEVKGLFERMVTALEKPENGDIVMINPANFNEG